MAGNQAVQRLIVGRSELKVQPKLEIGQPNDTYEREAERVAARVMRMPEPAFSGAPTHHEVDTSTQSASTNYDHALQRTSVDSTYERVQPSIPCTSTHQLDHSRVQRACACGAHITGDSEQCEHCTQQRIQRASVDSHVSENATLTSVDHQSSDHSLDPAVRHFMEGLFGHDFSQVQVHTDSRAAQAASLIDARAFTVGSDIFFGADEYRPQTDAGRRLIAHELTHTIQQSAAASTTSFQRAPTMVQRQDDEGRRSRPSALAELIVRLQREGRLDPAVLPDDVNPIPPLPVSRAEADRIGGGGVLAAGAAPVVTGAAASSSTAGGAAQVAGRTAQAVTRTGRVLTVIEGGAGAGASTSAGTGLASSFLRWGGAIGAFLAITLTPSSTAPAWMDTVSRITRRPYATPEEYTWERRLEPPQIEYLRREANRRAEPLPDPQRDPDEDEEEACILTELFPLGGNPEHDALAAFVTGQPVEYLLSTVDGTNAARYDGMDAGGTLYEIKTRHDFLHLLDQPETRLGPRGVRTISEGVPRIIRQIENQAMVAAMCGYEFRVATNNLSVIDILRDLAPGVPVEYVEFSWPGD